MGLALDESIEGLEKIESNGIGAYIDPNLKTFLGNYGEIKIDYINQDFGPRGFIIRVGDTSCGTGDGGCSSCE